MVFTLGTGIPIRVFFALVRWNGLFPTAMGDNPKTLLDARSAFLLHGLIGAFESRAYKNKSQTEYEHQLLFY